MEDIAVILMKKKEITSLKMNRNNKQKRDMNSGLPIEPTTYNIGKVKCAAKRITWACTLLNYEG